VTGSRGRGALPDATTLDGWLASLGIPVTARTEREGTTAWDVVLDGRRRCDVHLTLILQPGLGLVAWVPYAPPITDAFRRTYQQLLQWNDELPFVKFGLDPDMRLVLSSELPLSGLDPDLIGLAVARLLAVCDRLAVASADWLPPIGDARPAPTGPVGVRLLERYAAELAELAPEEAANPGSGA
jgi:hypothetical protein